MNGRNLQVSVAPDWRVLAFAAAAAVLSCCVSGLAPAFQAIRVNVNPALKEARVRGRARSARRSS